MAESLFQQRFIVWENLKWYIPGRVADCLAGLGWFLRDYWNTIPSSAASAFRSAGPKKGSRAAATKRPPRSFGAKPKGRPHPGPPFTFTPSPAG